MEDTDMNRILFVDCCVRENSRTKELARCVLDRLEGEIHRLDLDQEKLKPLDRELLQKRERLVSENDYSDDMFLYAKEFAKADTIVIAAPYWDLMFPALLKIYTERIMVSGITFTYVNDEPLGLCKGRRLIYITTSGGPMYYNFGFDYMKAMAETFFGIQEVQLFKAENLDMEGADVTAIMQEAKSEVQRSLE